MPQALIQIAFAGHNRAGDLKGRKALTRDLNAAFALIKAAGAESARLVTGLASGADELAAAEWKRVGLGPAHAVFPFLSDSHEIGPQAVVQSATWLDGAAAEAEGRNPHLQQTRWLVAAADLLVVVWTGEPARGAGGTADAVRLALERGVPVLWIKPAAPGLLRLIGAPEGEEAFDFSEFQETLQAGGHPRVEAATAERLKSVLHLGGNAPVAPHELPKTWRAVDEWLHGWLWKTFPAFCRLVGGEPRDPAPAMPPPPDLAEQPGFRLLTEAYCEADHRANRLSAVHRSEQILLLFGMVIAAFVGSSPAVWPQIKIWAVLAELALALIALFVWQSAARARQHERWSETRRLAEQLRLERAGWATGMTLPGSRSAREVVRLAGLPHGRFDADRVSRWGRWAVAELMGGQAAYHRRLSVRDGRIAHRLHLVEDISFVVLLTILAGFAVAYGVAEQSGGHLPHWAGGAVIMAGTVIPAIGAATLAMEAKLEFEEQSARSQVIAGRLEALEAELGPEPTVEALQAAARRAMRWLTAEADQWRDNARRRRLFRP